MDRDIFLIAFLESLASDYRTCGNSFELTAKYLDEAAKRMGELRANLAGYEDQAMTYYRRPAGT